jgi:methyltransferase (TIGR00027 family)
MAEGVIEEVADTAFWIAHYRGSEGKRADALFRDPLALKLAGERGERIAAAMGRARQTAWAVSIRTRVIDEFIGARVADIDAVLNLGAGLDTRPYRLELPHELSWIEVDQPHVIVHKESVLAGEAPRCQLERVGLDLADRAARRRLFERVAVDYKRVFVLTEGVVPYLENSEVAQLADEMRARDQFRYWLVDYFAPKYARVIHTPKRRRQMRNAPFRFFPRDWFGFFASHGWRARETRYLGEASLRYGRALPMPWWYSLMRVLIPREKQSSVRRLAAYVLLEPN